MDESMMFSVGIGIAVAAVFGVIAYFSGKKIGDKKIAESEQRAKKVVDQAYDKSNSIKRESKLELKEEWRKKKQEFDENYKSKKEEQRIKETAIQTREKGIDDKLDIILKKEKNLHNFEQDLKRKEQTLDEKSKKTDALFEEMTHKLEEISGMSREDASKQIFEELANDVRKRSAQKLNQIREDYKVKAKKEAVNIVIGAIQRSASDIAIDNTVSVVNLESDDMKGRIIGREGRNIRALEAATGVEIIVDDTPEAIILSCFDPVRREIARLSMHKLVTDGRIHPARIEEVVKKTEKQITQEIIEVGKRTVIDLGIHGLHPELIKTVGRMKYRSSYGQNLLQHSREVANLCGIMAAEMGLNAKAAKRAGLLHDIGKVPDTESELPHALLGMQWAEKYGEKPDVCNAIGAHHDEIEMKSLLSPIVQVCDAISGARPGARRQVLDSYIQRLKDLEEIAFGFNGVQKAYAIQAGRELRVMVESAKVNDEKAAELSFGISQKIQNDMTYPGQVKVTVIRETRAVNVAK